MSARNRRLTLVGLGWLVSLPFSGMLITNNADLGEINPIGAFMTAVVAGILAIIVVLMSNEKNDG